MKKFGLFCVVAALGCNTDQFTDVPADSNYFYVRLSPEAASLAVSQTQQLTMTAYDAGPCSGGTCTPFAPGNPLTVVQAPTFRSTDTTKVRVSSTGLVTAVGAGSANVIGTLQDLPGVTDGLSVSRVDTTIFTVTATPVGLGNLQLAGRAAGTPNSVSAASTLALTTTITDATGATVSTVGRPQYYSSNTAVATISLSGVVTGVAAGTATIYSTITVGGVTKSTTFPVIVTAASSGTFSITSATSGTGILFFPGSLTVSATQAIVEGKAGAVVAFSVTSGAFSATTTPNSTQCFNVTFANPGGALAAPPSTLGGNIGVGGASSADPPLCSGSRSRLFTTPGTYTFTSSTNGATGTLIVQ